jgi:hypothetical protein
MQQRLPGPVKPKSGAPAVATICWPARALLCFASLGSGRYDRPSLLGATIVLTRSLSPCSYSCQGRPWRPAIRMQPGPCSSTIAPTAIAMPGHATPATGLPAPAFAAIAGDPEV